jgi:hypothetical protein
VRIHGYFSKPKGVHEQKSLGNSGLVHCDVKKKVTPETGLRCLEGSGRLRLPDF